MQPVWAAIPKGTRPNLGTVVGRAFKEYILTLQEDLGPLPASAWPYLREAGLVECELRRLAGEEPTQAVCSRQGYLRQQQRMLYRQLASMAVPKNGAAASPEELLARLKADLEPEG